MIAAGSKLGEFLRILAFEKLLTSLKYNNTARVVISNGLPEEQSTEKKLYNL